MFRDIAIVLFFNCAVTDNVKNNRVKNNQLVRIGFALVPKKLYYGWEKGNNKQNK